MQRGPEAGTSLRQNLAGQRQEPDHLETSALKQDGTFRFYSECSGTPSLNTCICSEESKVLILRNLTEEYKERLYTHHLESATVTIALYLLCVYNTNINVFVVALLENRHGGAELQP